MKDISYSLFIHVATQSGLYGSYDSSSSQIAKKLGSSQQTISRLLKQMTKENLISRHVSHEGQQIFLTDKGREQVKALYAQLSEVVEKTVSNITGKVTSGLKEGRFYISQPRYQEQFMKKLGFRAFPGTLNLVIDPIKVKLFLSRRESIRIKGFRDKDRSYSDSISCKVVIEGIEAAIIIPERTHHPEQIIEIISPYNLRKKLKLKDGQKVTIA